MRKDSNRALYLFHDESQLSLYVSATEEQADKYLEVLANGGWRESSLEERQMRKRAKNNACLRHWRERRKAYIKSLEQHVVEFECSSGEGGDRWPVLSGGGVTTGNTMPRGQRLLSWMKRP